jgi:hypothetical protein
MPLPRTNLSGLEKVVKTARHAGNLAGVIFPAFQREDLGKHADYIIKDNIIVGSYVRRGPQYRRLLQETVKQVYDDYSKLLVGAKLVDSVDRVEAAVRGFEEVFPVVGQVLGAAEHAAVLVPKAIYSGLYAKGTGDYKAIPYFLAMEGAGFIPLVGEAIDLQNLYLDRCRKALRDEAVKRFLQKVKSLPPSQSNPVA